MNALIDQTCLESESEVSSECLDLSYWALLSETVQPELDHLRTQFPFAK
ncbi:MAG: hypothetical protein V7754_18800 [Halioglobus sp.]